MATCSVGMGMGCEIMVMHSKSLPRILKVWEWVAKVWEWVAKHGHMFEGIATEWPCIQRNGYEGVAMSLESVALHLKAWEWDRTFYDFSTMALYGINTVSLPIHVACHHSFSRHYSDLHKYLNFHIKMYPHLLLISCDFLPDVLLITVVPYTCIWHIHHTK